MLTYKMKHPPNWKILFLILQLVNTASSTYNPITVFTFDNHNHRKCSSLVPPEHKNTPFTLDYYCASKSPNNPDESVVVSPTDENILEFALIKSEQDTQCEAPVSVLRELNEESTQYHKAYYSVYGFYINSETEIVYEKYSAEKEWLTSNYIPYTAPRREIRGQVLSFVKLYESIDQSNRAPIYYQYTIAEHGPMKLENSTSTVADSQNKNCYPFEEVDFSDKTLLLNMLNEYIDEIKVDVKLTFLKEFLKKNYLRPTKLVPTSHLRFEGHQHVRGNCSVSLIWESIYENYLLEVDEAILKYAEKTGANVIIRTGTSDHLVTFNGQILNLKYQEVSSLVPAVVWKMVSKAGRSSDENKKPRETFFVVMIINNIFQNEKQYFKLFKDVILPLDNLISCESLGLDFSEKLKTDGIISCSKHDDRIWKKKLKAYNELRYFDKRSPPVSPRGMYLPIKKVKIDKQKRIPDGKTEV